MKELILTEATLSRGMLLTLSAWETRELQGSRSHRRDRERCTRKSEQINNHSIFHRAACILHTEHRVYLYFITKSSTRRNN